METTVVGLYVHGERGTTPADERPCPMLVISQVDAVKGWGLRQDARYFRPGDPGRVRRRQVSLIDEATLWRHEATFGPLDRALIKAQIILEGDVPLPSLTGSRLLFEGGAELTLTQPRKPCYAMDLIVGGLQNAMRDGRQGALAMVTDSGPISVGQKIAVQAPNETLTGSLANC